MRIIMGSHWLMVLLMIMGCTTTPQKVYVSRPDVLKAANEIFDIQVNPIRLDNPFFVGFQLTIHNKSQSSLAIDWNETQYMHNGKYQGIFVFKGVDSKSVSSGIPEEVISAGETFSKPIYPIKKLGFMEKRNVPETGNSNFFPGILPNGKNTASVVVVQGNRRWRELLTFEFDTTEMTR